MDAELQRARAALARILAVHVPPFEGRDLLAVIERDSTDHFGVSLRI